MLKSWGLHCLVDLRRCQPISIRCPANISLFSKTLVDRINMVPYGLPKIVHFGEDDKKGYTLVQLIETSSITGHFCESSGDAYIDVFSCKHFHQKDVEDVIHQYFRPEEIEVKMIQRG